MSDHWREQPREPAGSEEGGRWVEAGRAARIGAGLAQRAEYRDFGGRPAGRAMGDHVLIDRGTFRAYGRDTRFGIMAHELAHNLVEDQILRDPKEWERAAKALLLDKPDNHFEFILGQRKIGEAIVETISVYVTGEPDPMLTWEGVGDKPWSPEKWAGAMAWAEHALNLTGWDRESFGVEVNRLLDELGEP